MRNIFKKIIKLNLLPIKRNSKNRNISIISFHKLGDTVFSIPAIKTIQSEFQDYNISLFCFAESKDIYEISLGNVKYFIYGIKDFRFDLRIPKIKVISDVIKSKPGKLIDITGNVASFIILFFNNNALKIGFNKNKYRFIYNIFCEKRSLPHLIEMYLEPIYKLLDKKSKINFEYKPNFNLDQKIIIHPFGGWKAKEWNFSKYLDLALLLEKDYESLLIFPKNKDEKDLKIKLEKKDVKFKEINSITDLINEIRDCSLFIGNDSGPLYIANLLGKATFTIYGPTNPEYSLPFGDNHKFIMKKLICSPDGVQYCATLAGLYCPNYECMNKLTVEEVYLKVKEFVKELKINRKNEFIKNSK